MLNRNKIYEWEPVPRTEFNTDDYFNFNGAFGAVKFNPKLDISIRKSKGLDIYQKNNSGYVLYEMDNTSIIRPFSTRLLYNREKGIVRPLDGNNAAIYNTSDDMDFMDGIDFKTNDPAIRKHNLELVRKYFRFFFDHTTGRHGSFYICESFEEIKEPVLQFYNDKKNEDILKKHLDLLNTIKKENKINQLRTAFEKHFAVLSRNNKFKMRFLDQWDEKYLCSVFAVLIFKNTFFEVNIHIKKSGKRKIIELTNEIAGIQEGPVFSASAAKEFKELGYDAELPPFNKF